MDSLLIIVFLITIAFLVSVAVYTKRHLTFPEKERKLQNLSRFFEYGTGVMVLISGGWTMVAMMYTGLATYDPVTLWFWTIMSIIYMICTMVILICFHEFHPDMLGTERYNQFMIALCAFLLITLNGTQVIMQARKAYRQSAYVTLDNLPSRE